MREFLNGYVGSGTVLSTTETGSYPFSQHTASNDWASAYNFWWLYGQGWSQNLLWYEFYGNYQTDGTVWDTGITNDGPPLSNANLRESFCELANLGWDPSYCQAQN
jgi:hypothetical protein